VARTGLLSTDYYKHGIIEHWDVVKSVQTLI